MVGASLEDQYVGLFKQAGFPEVEVLTHLDYFSGSSSESTRKVAKSFEAHTVELRMVKPDG